MITLLVDEAYALDYYAILIVKKSILQGVISNHISTQLGHSKFEEIVLSQEFTSMLEANQLVFDCVERARYGDISAKELDDANMQRHYAKQALQKKFFSTNLTENKT